MSTHPTEVPPVLDSVADLDAAWVETVLRAGGHPAAQVAAITHEPVGAGNVSDTVRVAISYAADHADGGPDTLVVKFRPSAPGAHAHALGSGAYHREIGGYRAVGASGACRIPRTYFVGGDETTINLVMEDLTTTAVPGNQVAGCSSVEAEAVITQFARLHSAFPLDDAIAPDWLIRLPAVCDYWSDATTRGAELSLARFAGSLPAEDLAIVAAAPGVVRPWHLKSQSRLTLTHGDPRVDNVLFETLPDGRPGAVLIDWQVTGLRNPMYDVGYFLSGSVDVAQRRADEHRLLRHYVDVFAERGGSYDLEEATADYQLQLLSGLFITLAAVAVLPDNEVVNRLILALLERNCAAARDWHSIEAMRNVSGVLAPA